MTHKQLPEFLAHIDQNCTPHSLHEHLLKVAALAAEKAAPFMAQDWAKLAGQWHDLGKYRPGFQQYIRQVNGVDAHIENKVGGREKTHSAAGALWAIQTLREKHGPGGELAARVFAYLIASHHAGLYDWDSGLAAELVKEDRRSELAEALAANPPDAILSAADFVPDLRNIPGGSAGFALWVRMLFSCLVDADFLDTEAFFDQAKPGCRQGFPSLGAMLAAFDEHMDTVEAQAADTQVNQLRADILRQCRDKAELPPGFFSLTVPTGGGKTLASLAFALRHAAKHSKRRIIYAIPYTSIIEQTADVFRSVFKSLGDEVLIEHHSQADADEKSENARSRLACENWDAPLIVTTNVQLFESLFAAKTSRCRKLHNIAGSVIVLDEAQQLPPEFLQPILDVLNLLVKHYDVSFVLCTATQPALSSTRYFDANRNLRGLDDVREIIDDPDALYAQLKRVNVELPADWSTPVSWESVAQSLQQEDCVLAIVNTRKAARELHRLMPPGTIHLSALMCGAHRTAVIDTIKARLKAKREGLDTEPLRVISTQLVEAGVDLDFPVVWRALAGLDSIAQAAGRCNREGRIEAGGRVVVFIPENQPKRGLQLAGIEACRSVLSGFSGDPLIQRELMHCYFKDFYARDLDKHKIATLLNSNAPPDERLVTAIFENLLEPRLMEKAIAKLAPSLSVQFREAARLFRLIEDDENASVVVRYAANRGELDMLLNTLKKDGPQRWLMRKLQRYTISISKREAERLIGRGLSLPMPGLYVQSADGLYHEQLGFLGDKDVFNPAAYAT
ncbi:CRISPR-associated helicase Cas3' [Uliginosibacterium paludis]|uniref:CRISPR-associated helicase Cas3 n=1 Tax=Uliginosibacterium paludis TaxID=1615952 RepID=A0ABV2CPE6_9RHOO